MINKILKRQFVTDPRYFFALCAILFGGLFIMITPPFQAPDETAHYYRAYQVSTLDPTIDVAGKSIGSEIPVGLIETVKRTSTEPSLQFKGNVKYSIHRTKNSLSIDHDKRTVKFVDFSGTSLNTFISYLPQSIGIFIGSNLDLPPILFLYLGRIMNLLAWVFLIAVSIHLIPRKKWGLVALGLLPMAIFQASSLSPDSIAYGLTALYVSLILNTISSNKQIGFRRLLLLFALGVLMVLSKQTLFVFLPLVLLLKNKNFSWSGQAMIFKFLAMAVPIILLGSWIYSQSNLDLSHGYFNHQNPEEQIRFVVTNPHSFINVLWNTYFFNWGDEIPRSLVGNFGWVDTPLSLNIVIIGYVGLFLILAAKSDTEKAKRWLTLRQRLIFLSLAVLYALVVSASLYAYYSPVGFKIIVGLQGRYFVPALFLMIPALAGNWLVIKASFYDRIKVQLPLFLLLASSITIYFRYYINNV